MTWGEFRQWIWDEYGEWIPALGSTSLRWALFGTPTSPAGGRNGMGSGNPFTYERHHQLRYALYRRSRGLLSKEANAEWLEESEYHEDGWLVNDGRGIRWCQRPEDEALELARAGFLAVRCGV